MDRQARWSEHVDTCEVCPTLSDEFCSAGGELLGQLVAELQAEQADLQLCAWCPGQLPAKNDTGRPAYCSEECYLAASGEERL